MDAPTVAAALSAIAAISSAIAAWRIPLSAAKLSETMRTTNERRFQERQFQLNVFAEIMQGRAELYSEYSVRALNSIDIAFHRSGPVREAWAELYQALSSGVAADHVLEERVRRLLKEMAQELGLAESLRLDDFARVYFPTALAEDRQVRALERKNSIKRLTGQEAPTQEADALSAKWPPKPEQ